jgi:PAS domain S-box-containing protein
VKDSSNTKQELIEELSVLKKKIKQLEKTKFNHAEEALWESEEKFRRITENMSDFVLETDAQGIVKYASPSHMKTFGESINDIIGGSAFDYIHPEDRDRVMTDYMEAIQAKTDRETEYRFKHQDGHYIWIRSSGHAIFNDAGENIGNIINSQDITERKRMENELRESHKNLENKVQERTRELEEINKLLSEEIAERKRAKDVLRESEERFSNLVEQSPFSIQILDTSGNAIQVNRAFEELWGAPFEQMGSYNIFEDDQFKDIGIRPLLEKAFSGDLVEFPLGEFTARTRAAVGHKRMVQVIAYPVRDKSGAIGQVIMIYRDISKRKKMEDDLRKSEDKFRRITENMSDLVSDVDINGFYKYVSPSFRRMLGHAPENILGTPVFDKVHPEDMDRVFAEFTEGIRTKTDREVEYRYQHADGQYIWLRSSSNSLFDAAGEFAGAIINSSNISNRKQTEVALRGSEEKYRSLVENISEVIYTLDSDGRFTYISPVIERFSTYKTGDIIGRNFVEFIHPDDLPGLVENFNLTVQGELNPFEYRILDGDRVHHVRTSSELILKDGVVTGLTGVMTDITEQKQAEDEKRDLQERLNRAEKMEALGTLAGGVAHDLNNVLGIIVGYSEMILDDVDEKSSLKRPLVNIFNSGQKAAAIVDDLLTLARRGVPVCSILNLNNIINDSQQSPELAKLLSHHPAVKIKTDLDPDLLNISGSSVHLSKSLYNLISNASEAMNKGGILTIKTTNQYLDKPMSGYNEIREGDYVVLTISDTGEGISEKDLKRIFEPFYTKKIMGRSGTGLGLAVVWGTVTDHNGYINVHSEEGKGSTFTLYFPVTREEIPTEAATIAISEYMGNGQSILIVDDIKEQRDLATDMLQKLNYNVDSAKSGEEAVAYLKDHQTDLIVLDMIMDPGMDGLDTYKSIIKINPKQKTIIVSGFSESDRVKEAKRLGVGAYVRKPYIKEKLGMAVKKELDRK